MATLKDVARESGVAASTVSRAFSHPERLNPETVQRVRRVAEQLNYRVNPMAKALITGTSPVIGMCVNDLSMPFMAATIKGAQAEASQRGLWLVIGDTDESPSHETEWAHTLSAMARGLILVSPRADDEALRVVADHSRVVLLQRPVSGVASLRQDSRIAHTAILERLVADGHRHVAYLPGPEEGWVAVDRLRTFTEVCVAAGVRLTVLPHTEVSSPVAEAMTDLVLTSGATAVFCFTDVMAQGIVAGLHRRNLRPGRDLSVVGHDDSLQALAGAVLTTTNDLAHELGRRAVRRLLTDGDLSTTAEVLDSEPVFGETTGPVPTPA